MLKSKIILFLLGGALLLGMSSCKKGFEDVNINPDVALDVPPGLLLSGIEGDLATTQAGDMARFTAMITQQATGSDRQFIALYSYAYTNDSFDPMWKNTYSGHLHNLALLLDKADKNGYNTYSGIARCLTAYTLMQTSDLFGSIPYSQAFKGTENLQPKYDTQEEVYAISLSMLDAAIANLSATSAGALKPGSDDIIYGGNAAKWAKFAHTLKARAYLHWGKKDAANYGKALTELASGMTSGADDARFVYFGGQPGGAPMYQFIAQRGGYLTPNVTYGNLLTATGDTYRSAKYNLPFEDGHPYFTPTQAVAVLTATEAKFIKAECLFRTSGSAAALTTFQDAIMQSFSDIGLSTASATAYVATQTVTPALSDIMNQKYLALYCDPEVFSDWRRTGFPVLTATGPVIPRRFLYPTSEVNLNSNTPAAKITDRVAWDLP